MGNVGRDFIENFGLILGTVLLGLFFLLIGRGFRIGRSSGRGNTPRWQHPADRADKPEKPDKAERPERFAWGRGSRGGERKHDKREGGKPEKGDDHPGRGRKD